MVAVYFNPHKKVNVPSLSILSLDLLPKGLNAKQRSSTHHSAGSRHGQMRGPIAHPDPPHTKQVYYHLECVEVRYIKRGCCQKRVGERK